MSRCLAEKRVHHHRRQAHERECIGFHEIRMLCVKQCGAVGAQWIVPCGTAHAAAPSDHAGSCSRTDALLLRHRGSALRPEKAELTQRYSRRADSLNSSEYTPRMVWQAVPAQRLDPNPPPASQGSCRTPHCQPSGPPPASAPVQRPSTRWTCASSRRRSRNVCSAAQEINGKLSQKLNREIFGISGNFYS